MRERLIDGVRRAGEQPSTLFVLSREDFPDLEPLNTLKGQHFIDRVIGILGGIDLVVVEPLIITLADDVWQAEQSGQTARRRTGSDRAQSRAKGKCRRRALISREYAI